LLPKAIPYAGGTISCLLSQLPMNKQWLSKANPMLVVLTLPTSPQMSNVFDVLLFVNYTEVRVI